MRLLCPFNLLEILCVAAHTPAFPAGDGGEQLQSLQTSHWQAQHLLDVFQKDLVSEAWAGCRLAGWLAGRCCSCVYFPWDVLSDLPLTGREWIGSNPTDCSAPGSGFAVHFSTGHASELKYDTQRDNATSMFSDSGALKN
jgi:hypothetical protein